MERDAIIFGLLLMSTSVLAADQSVYFNASNSIYWEARNASDGNSIITGLTCELPIEWANGSIVFPNYPNSYTTSYTAVINGSFPIASGYIAAPNCTDGTSYSWTTFTFDVVSPPSTINVTGLITASSTGGGGVSSEVAIFLVVLVLSVGGIFYYYWGKK